MKSTVDRIIFARRAARSGMARALRVEAGLTQAEVAREVGVTAAAVCRWESGKRLPRSAAAERYGEFLERLGGRS